MASPWDERSLKEQRRLQNVLLRQTVLQMALGHVPYVRARFAALGLDARLFKGLEDLDKIPTTMRRDIVDPQRNPEGPGALVLRGTAEGVKRFSDRSVLRRVALSRLFGGEEMQELAIEAATRTIHLHLAAGPGGRIPVGYTRDDLDLLARAGARLATLVGLDRVDRLLNLVPFAPSLEFWGIFYMAHGVGMTAVHARREGTDLARAIDLVDENGVTAVAIHADEVAAFPALVKESGLSLERLHVLLAVGRSLTAEERGALGEELSSAGARDARIAAAYAPSEGRVLWGECPVPAGRTETFGFHTFPDMDLVEIVSPETAGRLGDETPGEIVLTPLGFRGGGAPRWRTGDLALGGMTSRPCPNCGRTVPRVGPTVQRAAWQHVVPLGGRRAWIDLRDAGAAAAERSAEWQVELVARDGQAQLFVYLDAPESAQPVISLYEELSRLKSPPTQIVLASAEELRARRDAGGGAWPRYAARVETGS